MQYAKTNIKQSCVTKVGVRQGTLLKLQPEAKAFLDTAQITDKTQVSAVNTFVKRIKAINEVEPDFVNFETPANSICNPVYLHIGGTAAKHKYNLINPVDSDAANRQTYSGALTHDEKGIKGDGVSAYINTHFSAANVGETSHGFAVFKGGGVRKTTPNWDLINGATPYISSQGASGVVDSNGQLLSIVRINEYSTSGLFGLNRKSQDIGGCEAYISGVKKVTTAAATSIRNASNFTLLGFGGAYNSNNIIQFAAFWKQGISEAAYRLLESAILELQFNLGRMPKYNVVFEGHSFLHNQPNGASSGWLLEKIVLKLNENYQTRSYRYVGSAISGSVIADLVTRKATAVDAYKMTGYGLKNIMPLWLGTNDITNTAGSGTVAYNAYKALYNSYVADGWTIIPYTITQKYGGVGQQEAERVIFNNLLKTDLNPIHLIDCDLIPELVDSNNATYFQSDKLHLTAAGNEIAAVAMYNKIASLT